MTRLRGGCFVVAVALAALVALPGCRRGGPDWRIVQLYGGKGSLQAIQQADSVTAFRIEPDPSRPEAGAASVGIHRVISGPEDVAPADAAALAAVFQDPDTYDWQRAKSCEFRPGVGLRFARGASRVDLALCFECDMLTIHREGRRIGVEDFDDARAPLVAIMQRTFPDDAEIQALEP